MADSRGANQAGIPGPSEADDLPLQNLSKSPLRNHYLPNKKQRPRDLFTTNCCHMSRFDGISVLRSEFVAKVCNITNPIAAFGTFGINRFPTTGNGL